MRRIEPRPVFAAYRPHFDEERAATQAEDWDVADELHREIKSPLRLVTLRWRWSYEPSDE